MRIYFLYIILIWTFPVAGQNVSFKAVTDARSLVENSVFEVSYTLENADGTDFRAPVFKEFNLVAGPSTSVSTTIINGKMSRSQSFTFVLRAPREGTFTIEPASIVVKGKRINSNSLTIEVVKGSSLDRKGNTMEMPGDEDVFVRAEPDTTVVYPGQQVLLNYVLYSRINVRNYNNLQEDPYENFYVRYVKDFNQRGSRVVIKGIQYQSQVLKSIALYPQQTGADTIIPFVARLGIGVDDPRNGLFFSMRTVPKTVRSAPFVIHIKPLPGNAPPSFTGAVGKYQMRANIDKASITTDEALVLSVLIRGTGDARRWEAPVTSSLEKDFQVYEPRIISDRSVDQSGVIMNEKRFEYRLIPQRTGRMNITLPFSFFDPDSSKYITLHPGNFIVHVSQGERNAGDLTIAGEFAESKDTLRGLKPVNAMQSGRGDFFLTTPYVAGFVVPVLGLFFLVILKRREKAFDDKSPEEKRRILAAKRARKILAEAETCMGRGDARGFYAAISRSVIGYIAVRLNIHHADITRSNLKKNMEHSGLPGDLVDKVMEKVRIADQALYAGMSGASDMQVFYEEMKSLFIDLESRLET